MNNTYIETLISSAESFWNTGDELPLDLAADMMAEGLMIDELQQSFYIRQIQEVVGD